jgi:hypothetical protein
MQRVFHQLVVRYKARLRVETCSHRRQPCTFDARLGGVGHPFPREHTIAAPVTVDSHFRHKQIQRINCSCALLVVQDTAMIGWRIDMAVRRFPFDPMQGRSLGSKLPDLCLFDSQLAW